MSRADPLDNVKREEFIKLVQEMKPKIGFLGGRYFVKGKKFYTMNQITKKYQEVGGSALGRVINEKDKQATEMLKKAGCFQKWMTKVKQKWGNNHFKSHHPQFIGKDAVLGGIRQEIPTPIQQLQPIPEISQVKEVLDDMPSSKEVLGAELEISQEIPVTIPQTMIVFEEKPELTPDQERLQREFNNFSGKDLKDDLEKIAYKPFEEQENSYYECLETYRKRGYLTDYYLTASNLCQEKVPEKYLKSIFCKLVFNACKEVKQDFDYLNVKSLAIIASKNVDDTFLYAAEAFLAEGNLVKAKEVLIPLIDQFSERAERVRVNIAMASVDQLNEGDTASFKADYWLERGKVNWEMERFGIARDAVIVAAKILCKQGKPKVALQVLGSIINDSRLLDGDDANELKEYLQKNESEFDHALKIVTRKIF